MTPREKLQLIDAITALAELFGRSFGEAATRMYIAVLADLPTADVLAAISRCAQTCRFMPAPAEVREQVMGGTVSDRAVIAWREYERAVRLEGPYRTVQFADPCIGLTIQSLGGWQRCCLLPEAVFDVHHRKDFERVYAVFARRGDFPESPVLLGLHDVQNTIAGYGAEPSKIVFIGEKIPAPQRLLEAEATA